MAVNRYTFADADDGDGFRMWNLSGPDAAHVPAGADREAGCWSSRMRPTMRILDDTDGDNVYKVTMWATDRAGGRAEIDICITVQNINEAGKVTLYDSNGAELGQPYEGQMVRAEVTDPDGGFRLRHTQWCRTMSPGPGTDTRIHRPAVTGETDWGRQ